MKTNGRNIMCVLTAITLAGAIFSGCQQTENLNNLKLQPEDQEKTIIQLFTSIQSTYTISSDLYGGLIAGYNDQSSTVEVRVSGLSTADGYNEALEHRLDEGKDVDLFIVNADTVKQLNAKGYFYDLSELAVFQALNDSAKNQATVNGTAYCVPAQMTAYGLYVNVGLLRKFGLEPPENAEAFLHCCEVLKENGITPIGINRWYAMTVFAMARGLYPIYQADNKDELIGGLNDGSIQISEYMLEGFRFFKELVDKGYYGDHLTAEGVDAIKANTSDWEGFRDEKTAFVVFPVGKEADIDEFVPEMEFIQQGIPALPDGTVSLPSISARICVNANGEHVEESLELLEYLTTHQKNKQNNAENGFMPVFENEDSQIDPRLQRLYNDASSPGQIPIEDMSLCFDYWGTIRLLCLDIIGGATPEEAAAEYDRIQMKAVEANTP